MKKLYSTPAMEVKTFEVEDIMNTSGVDSADLKYQAGDATKVESVSYDALFKL